VALRILVWYECAGVVGYLFFFLTFLGRVLVAWLVLVVVSHVRYALSSAIKIRLP